MKYLVGLYYITPLKKIFTFDPKSDQIESIDLLRFDITNFLVEDYNKFVVSAVTQESEVYNFPIRVSFG